MSRAETMVVHKRMSFLASLVWGVCSVIMVATICSAGVIFYALNVVENAINDLPALVRSVPFLDEAVSSVRRVDYIEDLDIEMSFSKDLRHEDRMRVVATVVNEGEEVVSLLVMRVVVSDQYGNVVDEDTRVLATPFGFDDDMPGPLLPGAKRRATTGTFRYVENPSIEYEISEIRISTPSDRDCGGQTAGVTESMSAERLVGANLD